MKKFVIAGLLAFFVLFLTPAVVVGYSFYDVFIGDYDHLKKERILEILSKETTLYYADGQSQLGSLFGTEHRQYVPLREIPKHMLEAIVAAEDDGFYRHSGVDFISTLRAVYRNVILRRREGASTITQQTVKNLYGRVVTNYFAKYKEALNAFKMEKLYSKDEILEFYLNQFHVTGNGHGVGVAAKYYFDKETTELTLTEAAFIAGSVKGPERYNPFTKKSAAAQAKAHLDAKNRKNYVLRRMLENKFVAQAQFEVAAKEEVPFRQGKFQFNELFITEIVQRQMARKEVLEAIGAENIDQVGSMGLRITTTLEKKVQQVAQYGVRQNLSRLEMILGGFKKENPANFSFVQKPEKLGFYPAKVSKIILTPKEESITLSFGLSECFVPTQGIDRVAKITDQTLYQGLAKAKARFLSDLQVGDTVLASVSEVADDGKITCDIERRPRVQGALIVLNKGQIVSMVGGYSPHEYNRAIFAKRQPGSTFKTLTYYSALQLGWSALEPLLNIRSVHNWQGQFYYPRPDHAPTVLETTLFGAGSHSENLASVYLLARVLDKLTFSQFRDLLEDLGLYHSSAGETELLSLAATKFNVKFRKENLEGGVFEFLRNDRSQDLDLAQNPTRRAIVRGMSYGINFDKEIEHVASTPAKALPQKEKVVRLNVLRNNFQRWKRLAESATAGLLRLQAIADGDLPSAQDRQMLADFRLMADDAASIAFVAPDAVKPNALSPLLVDPVFKVTSADELLEVISSNRALLNQENVLLDGVVPLSLIREYDVQIQAKYQSIQDASPLEKLYWHDDFRYSLGMIYAQRMTKNMGVQSEIRWVPSYPLGANVVTLSELALSYQTLLNGKTYRYFEEGPDNQVVIIKRIEDAQGNLLWEQEADDLQVVDSFYSPTMLSILHGTVTNGTARAAYNNVILRSNDPKEDEELQKALIRVPIFGKTGTTNDYVNATFVGFLPFPDQHSSPGSVKELDASNVYTIASYVGYDTNEPMRRRGFKVAGGTGALPAWIEAALALIKENEFSKKIEWKGLAEQKKHEIPFNYGGESAEVVLPIHSSVSQAGDALAGDDEKTDLNASISDYQKQKAEPLFSAHLPGEQTGMGFMARTRVSFFQKSSTEKEKVVEGGEEKAVDDNAGAKKIEEEKFSDDDELDLNRELPPIPKDL